MSYTTPLESGGYFEPISTQHEYVDQSELRAMMECLD